MLPIKTPICHHWSQLTQPATTPPGSAHQSLISASALRKKDLATPNFSKIFRKLHISGRSVALSCPYSRRFEFVGAFKNGWPEPSFCHTYGHAMGRGGVHGSFNP